MKILCKNKHWDIAEDYDIDKILYLLVDRPTLINDYYRFVWFNRKRQLHRDYDLPSTIHNNGHISWYKNHKSYRKSNNNPVRIWRNGEKYYLNDCLT